MTNRERAKRYKWMSRPSQPSAPVGAKPDLTRLDKRYIPSNLEEERKRRGIALDEME